MNTASQQDITVFFNLDILFDFYSVLFSAYRTYYSKNAIPIHELKYLIEGKSFEEGLMCLVHQVSESMNIAEVKEELRDMINMSLSSIKPNIGVYTLFTDLVKSGVNIKIFTHFEDSILAFIKQDHKSWFNFDIVQWNDITTLKSTLGSFEKDSLIFIDSSIQNCLDIRKDLDIQTVYIPYSKHSWKTYSEDEKMKETLDKLNIIAVETLEQIDWKTLGLNHSINWTAPSYYLQLNEKPKNLEYEIWTNTVKFENTIELVSDIVHGYGRGGKKLGIPTANLDMTPEIEDKLRNLVSGVYYGWAQFISSNESGEKEELEERNKYPMVMSIGFNPYFNNKHKTAEAHIMRSFKQDFYGSRISVTILGFIRNEADFMSFSHLIEAIHNDVQVTKDLLSVELN